GIADKLNSQPKYVVSSTLARADWNNSTIIANDACEAIRALKQQSGGEIGITGSATLAQSLIHADLVDEIPLFVYPIVLGSGKRLFPDGLKRPFTLIKTQPFNSGVVLLNYQSGNM